MQRKQYLYVIVTGPLIILTGGGPAYWFPFLANRSLYAVAHPSVVYR